MPLRHVLLLLTRELPVLFPSHLLAKIRERHIVVISDLRINDFPVTYCFSFFLPCDIAFRFPLPAASCRGIEELPLSLMVDLDRVQILVHLLPCFNLSKDIPHEGIHPQTLQGKDHITYPTTPPSRCPPFVVPKKGIQVKALQMVAVCPAGGNSDGSHAQWTTEREAGDRCHELPVLCVRVNRASAEGLTDALQAFLRRRGIRG